MQIFSKPCTKVFMMQKRIKSILLILTLSVFFGIAIFYTLIKITEINRDKEVIKQSEMLKAQYDKILDSASISPTKLTIDYRKQISTGSPLIFGGSGIPPLEHTEAWDLMADVGITSIRTDLAMNWMIRNTTLDNYKNNVNNIRDISNWNKFDLDKLRNTFIKAKKLKMSTIGIIDYAPPWLTFDNTDFGVPKDWEIFEDIVKKNYEYHRDYLDYVEIWNEANHSEFLTLGNSSLTREEAYGQIYHHAVKAIREVDAQKNDGKRIKIGGPVDPSPKNTSLLKVIISDEKNRNNTDFISYHNYDIPEPSWNIYKSVLREYQMEDTPIFITEWNIDGRHNIDNQSKTSNAATTYTGRVLTKYLEMGVKGANYYGILPVNDSSFLGFYRIQDRKTTLLPQARTWRILSKQMGLGAGESRIYATNIDSRSKIQEEKDTANITEVALNAVGLGTEVTLNSVGFRNSKGEYGTAIVNSTQTDQVAEIEMKNTGIKKFAKVKVYYANAGNEAKTPVYEGLAKSSDGNIKFSFYIPAESVIGIKFEEEKQWYELFN